MRVTESKSTGKVAIMGKKKHKKRKQEQGPCPSDSSDEGGNTEICPHLSKAINFSSMKKGLKQAGHIGQCTPCANSKTDNQADEIITEDSALGGATGGMSDVIEEEKMFDIEPTVWVCLQCGFQGCDRNSKEQHALKHYETPRSSVHSLVVNVNSWSVWCYLCNYDVNPNSSTKLRDCIDFIRKLMDPTSGSASVRRSSSFRSDEQISQESGKIDPKPTRPKPISQQAAADVTQALPKVKGLSNLGNTCFFNAVMQNLSQTNLLETLLNERGAKGIQINLQGKKFGTDDNEDGGALSDSTSSSDEEDDKIKCHVPALSVSLGEPGNLTVSVISFMKDMRNPSKCSTICPNSLFGQVCKKAPRFKGFQQQDSHELLRHLLDGMKAEEIKRGQAALLKQFKLPENVNPKKVDEEDKMKIKVYGKQVKHTFVDEVFGGVFLSTVLCDECNQPSQIYERFLDISLPILEEKTARPNIACGRKKEEPDTTSTASTVDTSADKGLSKHQQKKLRKQSLKETKKKAHCTKTDAEVAPAGGEEKETKDNKMMKNKRDTQSQSDGQMSDADIEDNIESDVSRNKLTTFNSQEDIDKPDSPIDNKASTPGAEAVGTSCVHVHRERHDSTGRSEESTLTETSAGESKTGCSSCNSIASLSDSTCKASSVESPFGSNMGLNQPQVQPQQQQQPNSIEHLTEAMSSIDIAEKNNTQNHKHLKESFKDSKSDLGSSASVSLDNAEETASTSNGMHHGWSQRSHSSGYSSTTTSKSSCTSKPRSQLRLEAKVKAMASLVPRYQPGSQECSLKSCLNQFTAAEWLTGSNKFGCETCTKRKYGRSQKDGKKETVYTNASKQVIILQPPAVLTLHLKRFQQVGFSLRKVNRHVNFPMLLDLAPYCSSLCQGIKPGQTKVMYALYGVVEHSGRLTGGHYTAYIKVRPQLNQLKDFINRSDITDTPLEKLLETLYLSRSHDAEAHGNSEPQEETVVPPTGKWYHISDSSVTEAREETVLRCQAYILFYERIL